MAFALSFSLDLLCPVCLRLSWFMTIDPGYLCAIFHSQKGTGLDDEFIWMINPFLFLKKKSQAFNKNKDFTKLFPSHLEEKVLLKVWNQRCYCSNQLLEMGKKCKMPTFGYGWICLPNSVLRRLQISRLQMSHPYPLPSHDYRTPVLKFQVSFADSQNLVF